MKIRILLVGILIITGTTAFPANSEKKDQFGIEWCFDRKASLDENQLRCLRSLDETQIVKNGLADSLRRHRTCPKCKEVIADENKYLSYYKYPFLVISAGFHEQGTGILVHFIFKQGPPEIFDAFMIVNDNNVNEFRVIDSFPPTRQMIRLVKRFREKKFDQYWVPGPQKN